MLFLKIRINGWRFERRSVLFATAASAGGRSWVRPCSPSSVIWHMQRFAPLQALRQWSKETALTEPGNKNGNKGTNDSAPDPSLMFDLWLITGSPPTDFKLTFPHFPSLTSCEPPRPTVFPSVVYKNRFHPKNIQWKRAVGVHKASNRDGRPASILSDTTVWSDNTNSMPQMQT